MSDDKEPTMRERIAQDFKAMSLEDAETEITKRVYLSSVAFLELLEAAGKINGNGHHMAQNLAEYAANMVKERWMK